MASSVSATAATAATANAANGGQPTTSEELIALVVSDLKKYCDSNAPHLMKDPIEAATNSLIEQIDKLHSISMLSTLTESDAEKLTPIVLKCHSSQIFKEDLNSFLFSAVKSRLALARLVHTYLSEIQKHFKAGETSLEEDTTGYFAASLFTLNQILDKIIQNQISAVQDVQSSYRVLATNQAYPLPAQRCIDQRANLYLIRHHSICPSCKERPPVAKALLQNAPLCQVCLDEEKKIIFQ